MSISTRAMAEVITIITISYFKKYHVINDNKMTQNGTTTTTLTTGNKNNNKNNNIIVNNYGTIID